MITKFAEDLWDLVLVWGGWMAQNGVDNTSAPTNFSEVIVK